MKNIYLFFFTFIIVLNKPNKEKILLTKNRIDGIVKNIKQFSNCNLCNIVTINKLSEKFELDEYNTKELRLQLNKACRYSKGNDKEFIIRVIYEFFNQDNKRTSSTISTRKKVAQLDSYNELSTYLCLCFMEILGFDTSEC